MHARRVRHVCDRLELPIVMVRVILAVLVLLLLRDDHHARIVVSRGLLAGPLRSCGITTIQALDEEG